MERAEEDAAVDAEAVEAGGEVGVGHVHDDAAVRGLAVEALDARGAGFDLGEQPEALEDGLAGGLEEEAGSYGGWLCDPLEDLDVVAGVVEEQRGRRAAGSAADDGDAHRRSLGAANVNAAG